MAAALDSLWADDDEVLKRRFVRLQWIGWPLLLASVVLMLVEEGLGPALTQKFWVGVRRAGHDQMHVRWVWDLFSQSFAGVSFVGMLLYLFAVQRDRVRAQFVLLVPLLSGLVVNVLKAIAGRERPDGSSLSWPSGHASSAFSVALICWVLGLRGRWFVVAACAVGAVARIMLERHWPADVVGSLGIACLMTAFAARIPAHLGEVFRTPRFVLLLAIVLALTIAVGMPFDQAPKLVRRSTGILFAMLTAFWAHDRLRAASTVEVGRA